MAYFKYKARTSKGKMKEGRIKADSKREAVGKLKDDGMTVATINELNSILYKDIQIGSQVKNKEFVIYLRQFATLLESGISLIQSTYILKDQTSSKALQRALTGIAEDLEGGLSFSDAAEKHQKIFPDLFVNMVRAGEAGGNLDEILDRLAAYYEKQYDTRQKVISALAYPLVVLVIAIGIVIFLLSFVVPRFADMFLSFGGDIPPITQFVMSLGEISQKMWWLFIVIPLLAYGVIRYMKQYPRFSYGLDLMKLRIPIFGPLIQKSVLARMTRTMSSLFNSSVPILQAVYITERIVGNKVVESVLKTTRKSLEKGESMAGPMKNHWIFPPLVTQMISVGESSGSLDHMLGKVADFYESELDYATDRIKSLIEPVMIAFLALIVGGIVAAIAIPMFSIFEQIG
ncbi:MULTISPECIES: type II secretion system F family protein [Pontibacillus]|uniref:Type II secretion system F family protein n=1 Tax=Pontibacillus chungwhensis TaxID=265426 RepID=A0ABY8UTW1_9BACI|nr:MULTISPECIES: type II secretion system F family protein [Pontibacillus]MCD5323735.1 type II secretion system F family protein [Pontibacillus sp. HN14]WIF97101.1 type II secretion system F family protein [Pontibacillus chungwhensis]